MIISGNEASFQNEVIDDRYDTMLYKHLKACEAYEEHRNLTMLATEVGVTIPNITFSEEEEWMLGLELYSIIMNKVLKELEEQIQGLETRRIKTTERVNKTASRILHLQICSGVALLVFIIVVLILCKMIKDIKQNREDANVFDDMEEEDDEEDDEVDILREIVISHRKMLQRPSNNTLSAPAA